MIEKNCPFVYNYKSSEELLYFFKYDSKWFRGSIMKEQQTEIIDTNEFHNLYEKSKKLIDNARNSMGQMANTITVLTSFLLGQYIVEQEQQGSERAKYGAKVLDSLSAYLTEEYGRGFSRSNVAGMRQFYMAFKDRENEIIQLGIGQLETLYGKIPFKLSWTQSDEALVDLTLPENANIYAKEYKLYLPDKKLLQKKLKEWLDEEQKSKE